MAIRKARPKTATSLAPATIRCLCSNQFGDLERSTLRPGNVHSADGWRSVLEPVVARYRTSELRRYFRGDAAFAAPDIYDFLEAEGYKGAVRNVVGIRCGAISGNMRVSFQAARSIPGLNPGT